MQLCEECNDADSEEEMMVSNGIGNAICFSGLIRLGIPDEGASVRHNLVDALSADAFMAARTLPTTRAPGSRARTTACAAACSVACAERARSLRWRCARCSRMRGWRR